MGRFWHQFLADKPFYMLMLGYMAAALLIALSLGDLKWFVALMYLEHWIAVLQLSLAAVLIFHGIAALSAPSPIAAFTFGLFRFWHTIGPGLVLFSCVAVFHGAFLSIKVMMPEIVPFNSDPILADLDEAIHFGPAWQYLRFLDAYTLLIRFFYTPVWLLVMTGGTLLICVSRPSRLRTQYLWTFFLCWILLGNVLAIAFMSVGPLYYYSLLGDLRFSGLTSHLYSLASPDDPTSQIPQALWTAYVSKTPAIGSGISAFPSLHLSMATLFVLAGFQVRRWLGWIMSVYLFVIMLGSVHLGWHYAIDGYVAIVATVVCWLIIGHRSALEKAPSKPFPPVPEL